MSGYMMLWARGQLSILGVSVCFEVLIIYWFSINMTDMWHVVDDFIKRIIHYDAIDHCCVYSPKNFFGTIH